MRSLAVKIFLGFWLIHALIFLVLALVPDAGRGQRFLGEIAGDARVAAALLEDHGPASCAAFVDSLSRDGVALALFDGQQRLACPAATSDPLLGAAPGMPDAIVESAEGRHRALVRAEGPSGRTYRAVAVSIPGSPRGGRRPPVPYTFLTTAVIVSGVVCFLLARYVASPLQRMRAATHRLAAGDLDARAGAGVRQRRDEVGDLVRDFDAMADRISSLMHSQTQLLSDISHELRSPLARLNVALELARRKAGTGASAELDRIQTETERMNQLIGQVLALSRAERDERASRRERVDLADLVRGIAEDADFEARRAGKVVAMEGDVSAMVEGDVDLIASAIENVVRNAVRHTADNSTVEVGVTSDGAQACVTVRDHGPGVPEHELERIFAPFHRVGTARSRESGGVGLGLAIARRAVTVHGGTIAARNAATGGLEVEIRLPRR